MANSNDYVSWATAAGANVNSPAVYAAATIRQQGAQYGIADPVTFNNAMRQASMIAAMIAQFTADYGPGNVVDDGNLSTLETQYIAALTRLIDIVVGPAAAPSLYNSGPDTGSANTYVFASPSPNITSYVAGLAVLTTVAHANTGGSTVNFAGLGAVTLVRTDGSALQANDLRPTGTALLVYNSSNQFVVLNILPTSTSVPTANTTTNGISRQATTGEMSSAHTSGSTPAFVTPEGLVGFEAAWKAVDLSASSTRPETNEYIILTTGATFSTTLQTPVGNNGEGYLIYNGTSANQNIITPAGVFVGTSDVGSGSTNFTLPPNGLALLWSDGTNWYVNAILVASINNRGQLRVANSTEQLNGVTSGSFPAAMTPEGVATFFFAQVATTANRGIARQATNTEMTNAVTTGTTPAFVTPEGLALYNPNQNFNPFTYTGIGAAILMKNITMPSGWTAILGQFMTLTYDSLLGYLKSPVSGFGANLGARDNRWLASNPPGTWQVVYIDPASPSAVGIGSALLVRTA